MSHNTLTFRYSCIPSPVGSTFDGHTLTSGEKAEASITRDTHHRSNGCPSGPDCGVGGEVQCRTQVN